MLIFLLLFFVFSIMVIGGILMQVSKQNELFGLRTPATLSDSEIWEKSNKTVGKIISIIGLILLTLNFITYIYGLQNSPFCLIIIAMLTLFSGIFIAIFGYKYSEYLKSKKSYGDVILKYAVSKKLVFILSFLSLFMAILGFYIFFRPSDMIIINKLSLSGIGFITIGLVFSFLFFTLIKKDDSRRTKLFEKYFILFGISTIILSILLAIFVF